MSVNAEECQYMVMSRDQSAGKNRNGNVGNKIVERNEPFK